MSARRPLIAAAAAAAALLACSQASAAFPGANGKIVFEDDGVLKTIEPSGTGLAAIPDTTGATLPSISPDGTHIAVNGIHTFDFSGADDQLPATGSQPAWSPDGSQLVYQRDGDLWLIDVEGAGPEQQLTSGTATDISPSWAPNGDRIAFVSDRSDERQVWITKPDPASPIVPWQVTIVGDVDGRPSWSPDGSKVVYSIDDGTIVDLYVTTDPGPPLDPNDPAPLDPANDVRITVNGASSVFNDEPAWSPDGTRIAFSSTRGGSREIWTVAAPGGGGATQVTTGGGRNPDWQPNADADGDALLDDWEQNGIDLDHDAIIDLDLPAMGADPMHKDIFVEIDHMAGHALSQAAIDAVVAAFEAAPVANPDGLTGVTLHVDNGPSSAMDAPSGLTWGALSKADELAHVPVLGSLAGNGDYEWDDFDVLKAANFSSDRSPAFHYVISAHRYGSAAKSSSGISRDFGASDLLVTLGPVSEPGEGSGSAAQQAGTLMHELGHNLGLHHGGADDTNYNPNYLSIMNYSFQMSGLLFANGTSRLDYASVGVALDEANLDQANGFGFAAGTPPAAFLSLMRCPTTGTFVRVALLAGPLDWDCDPATSGSISVNLNDDAVISARTPFLDWPALIYSGGAVGDLGAVVQPATTALIEPELEELLANQRVMEAPLTTATPGPAPGPGPPVVVPDRTAPSFTGAAKAVPATFAVNAKGARETPVTAAKAKRGTRFRYSLSEAARVVFAIERRTNGRRAAGRCVKPTRSNRKRKPCVRFAAAGAFAQQATLGSNVKPFSGRIGSRKLAPGRYRATLRATDAAGNRSLPKRIAFRVVKR